jgi:hypothetical protein
MFMNASTRTSRRRVALAACITLLALLVVPAALASTKSTKANCGKQVVTDWYVHKDHRVHGHYPLYCYREALDSLDPSVDDYTNARTAIQAALAAEALRNGGGPGGPSGRLRPGQKPILYHNTYDFSGVPTGDATTPTNTSGPSSVPVPLLVLAGLAVLLLTAGGAGYVARRVKGNRDGGSSTPTPDPADS